MTAIARDDYSFTRPSSRREEAGAIYPGLRSALINLTVIIDTSGSIASEEMASFASEINAIKGQIKARVTLHACDSQVCSNGPGSTKAWEELTIPDNIEGGGGTDFGAAISWVNQCDQQPDLLVYFTDAQGRFPSMEPSYPVSGWLKASWMYPGGRGYS